MTRPTVYEQRGNDPAFAAAWGDALDDAVDILAAAARQRALTESDTLLIYLLKVHGGPEWRKDRQQIEVSGPGGGPIPHEVAAVFAQMGPAELRRLLSGGENAALPPPHRDEST